MERIRFTPAELVESLRNLADASYLDTFPHVPRDETVEAEAADFIDAAVKFLEEIASAGGPLAERARRILTRLE